MTAKSAEPQSDDPFVVTIDGPAGVGKSTTARLLAKELGLVYLDTGATYRALAYAALQKGLHPIAEAEKIAELAGHLRLKFHYEADQKLRVTLSGKDITTEIRTEGVTEAAAQVAQHPEVRKAMVDCQRHLASDQGVVVEGRDTGTVVFPNARFKFFLEADANVRADRRQREMGRMYGAEPPIAQIREQLNFRDRLDTHRRVGPLVKPDGAIAIDTSDLTTEQVVQKMIRHIRHSVAG